MISELVQSLTFAALAGLVAISALLVVLLKNLLHAAVALFFCLTGIAALYVLLGADFLGVSQLLIYAGGILVLLIFGIFLTTRIYDPKAEAGDKGPSKKIGAGISLVIFGLIWSVISKAEYVAKAPTHTATTKELGNLLLTKYLLPFELISILLLFAMVGSVILVRKELGEKS